MTPITAEMSDFVDEPICERCAMAFWRNIGLPVGDYGGMPLT
jgi:hypothetical protein